VALLLQRGVERHHANVVRTRASRLPRARPSLLGRAATRR
jgi:hypothetical protein